MKGVPKIISRGNIGTTHAFSVAVSLLIVTYSIYQPLRFSLFPDAFIIAGASSTGFTATPLAKRSQV
jgi:hypothetical protein